MTVRYHIELATTTGRADLVDLETRERWHFAGGYDPHARLLTQAECQAVVDWLGERRMYEGSLIQALEEARKQ